MDLLVKKKPIFLFSLSANYSIITSAVSDKQYAT